MLYNVIRIYKGMEFFMVINEFINRISSGAFDEQFRMLYGSSEKVMLKQKARYLSAAENFSRLYPECGDIGVFSAPGRTEIGGNHTDHQNGCVIAAAVDIDVIAIVSFHDEGVIRIKSEGFPKDEISLDDLSVHDEEKGTSASIIRGIASKFIQSGIKIGGFDAYTTSEVISGSGLSSSAAFEVLIGTIIDRYYNNGRMGAVEIAKIGQYAENVYFGKASGLMDQMVSSVGGFVFIDFKNSTEPYIVPIRYDFESSGYCICITDTKGDHSELSGEYSSVAAEMKHVAVELGGKVLSDVEEEMFYEKLPELRKLCNDREILRAAHFFDENKRAGLEKEALECGNTEEFFSLVNESGDSSANLLQNLFVPQKPEFQEIPIAIMLSKRALNGCGAVRVHGGGFAGTIQAFVPVYMAEAYSAEMNRIFGEKSCIILNIRPVGGFELTI